MVIFSRKKEYSETIFPFYFYYSHFGKILHHKKIATSQRVEYMPIKSLKKKASNHVLLEDMGMKASSIEIIMKKISYNKPMIVGGCHFQCMRSCIQNIMVLNKID